ncbi:uncharacterized protein LOC110738174 [Chenopodium quinoa]|uniref:uncharacterized protein LOC110738174 n=1 Tax=Chenopodium quinoa TaxID=63459 RepID=UPI000B76C369|nr:uncharacterized protein LOC110738174 [Chenopodium quinoa]
MDWWDYCFKELEITDVENILTICWANWSARNAWVIEGEHPDLVTTINYAMKICGEVREGGGGSGQIQGQQVVSHPVSWTRPELGCIKLNVDAGLLGDVGSGFGAVARDCEGNVLGCAAYQCKETWEAKIAEAKVIVLGMNWAIEMGFKNVVVESDCLQLIQALRKGSKGQSNFHLILDDVLSLCSSFDFISWSFVKCSGNKVAHTLAHYQPWELGRRVWVNDVPSCISPFVSNDLLI